MLTHFSVLAWRIPGTGEPDGLLSMGSHRVGHDRSDLAAAADMLLSLLNLYLHIHLEFWNHMVSCPFPLFFLIFIYLAALGLNCGMCDLVP